MELAKKVRVCDGCGKPPFSSPSINEIEPRVEALLPLKACRRCHQAFYHNVDCQKRHYAIHKISCRKWSASLPLKRTTQSATAIYTVEQTRDKGRCLVAARDIAIGEKVGIGPDALVRSCTDTTPSQTNEVGKRSKNLNGTMRAQPLVPPVLIESHRSTHCAVCFNRCSRQKQNVATEFTSQYVMQFCSAACQQTALDAGLDGEQLAIRSILEIGRIPKILPTALLVYRLIMASNLSLNDHKDGSFLPRLSWSSVSDMVPEAGSPSNSDSAEAHEQAILFTVVSLFQEATKQHSFNQSAQNQLCVRIREALSRVKANAFSITSESDGDVVGIALFEYPAYLMNHSCRPNATQSFSLVNGQFPCLVLVANQKIAKGEEITISYMDQNDLRQSSRIDRRQMLQKSYHFICQCSICV
mmetsp:Transcript_10123/g.20915  ORF Transcript_10123/g.20915 Transcript_10123/m.20915 type:complete len:414 (-) Transcript_10123:37-1278(-)